MPVVILCSRLDSPGGIERAVVNTANLLQENGHTIILLVVDETTASFYPLHKGVRVLQAALDFGITEGGNAVTRKIRFYTHVQGLKTVLQRLNAGVVIGTEYPLTIAAYLACRKKSISIFSWEHHHFYWLDKSRFWQWLFRTVYPKLHGVVCLNDAEKQLFEKAGCRAVVIPNFASRRPKATLDNKSILSVGWLIKRKGFDRIPAIAKQVFEKHPDWCWKIIGTGEEKGGLEKALADSGLSQKVIIQSPVSAALEGEYRAASLFVMTSRFECFPMVLLEAMAHGVPCISFDCPTGPGFIISNGADGLLIEPADVQAMANGIIDLIQNKEKRAAFGDEAYKNIRRFSPEKILALWQDFVLKRD